jgi:hypothetical protein
MRSVYFSGAISMRVKDYDWKGKIHYHLNTLVLRYGHWPIVGRVVWWAFGNWQRFM